MGSGHRSQARDHIVEAEHRTYSYYQEVSTRVKIPLSVPHDTERRACA
jgi:hypothetical protein